MHFVLHSLIVYQYLFATRGSPKEDVQPKLIEDSPYVIPVCSIFSTLDICTLCTGTLIRPDRILISQLCLQPPPSHKHLNLVAITKIFNLQNSSVTMIQRVHEWVSNPSFEVLPYAVSNDIAVLQLEENFDSANKKVVSIASRASLERHLVNVCEFLFWPTKQITSRSKGNYLATSFVFLMARNECKSLLPKVVIGLDQVCATIVTGGMVPSQHSGGPLICSGIQCGLFTWQKTSVHSLPVLIFTKLGCHEEFINSVVPNVMLAHTLRVTEKASLFKGSIDEIVMHDSNTSAGLLKVILLLLMVCINVSVIT